MKEVTKRKLLRVLCHGAALASSSVVVIGLPIAIVVLSEDPLVKDSAKEAINYTLNIFVMLIMMLLLCFTIIGIPFAMMGYGVISIAAVIMPLIAMVSVCIIPDGAFRYPFVFRFINTKAPKELQDTRVAKA
ncbi:MAG: DUF4870 domain-containing protein [Cyanobacteria bacterium]|nr:DUF4870 domain-containing protein [Cyanobacteriota bacterium]